MGWTTIWSLDYQVGISNPNKRGRSFNSWYLQSSGSQAVLERALVHERANKIRHFIWRATIDSLPTKKNLQMRKIIQDPTCDWCGDDIKDRIHALWGCQMVKHVWWEMECCKKFLSEKFASFQDLFQGILAQKNQQMAELFAYMGWSIWYNRNAKRVGSSSLPMEKLYNDAIEQL